MIKLGKLIVRWHHFNPLDKRVIYDEWGRKYVREFSSKEFFGTKCIVHLQKEDELPETTVVGIARLYKYNLVCERYADIYRYEEFNKDTGRKISLTNALNQLNLSKKERKEVWKDYNGRRKHLINTLID